MRVRLRVGVRASVCVCVCVCVCHFSWSNIHCTTSTTRLMTAYEAMNLVCMNRSTIARHSSMVVIRGLAASLFFIDCLHTHTTTTWYWIVFRFMHSDEQNCHMFRIFAIACQANKSLLSKVLPYVDFNGY